MPQLDPTWFASQLFWLVVCFFALYFVLSRIILPPILGIVGKREFTIGNDVSTAEKLREQAAHAKLDYERTLAQSREMAQGLMNEVMDENKAHAEKTMKALDVEIAKKLDEATIRIKAKKLDLMANLTPAAAEFASMIAEKITSQPAKTETANRLVMDLLKSKRS